MTDPNPNPITETLADHTAPRAAPAGAAEAPRRKRPRWLTWTYRVIAISISAFPLTLISYHQLYGLSYLGGIVAGFAFILGFYGITILVLTKLERRGITFRNPLAMESE